MWEAELADVGCRVGHVWRNLPGGALRLVGPGVAKLAR